MALCPRLMGPRLMGPRLMGPRLMSPRLMSPRLALARRAGSPHRNTRAPARPSRSRPPSLIPFRRADRRASRSRPGLGSGLLTVNRPSAMSQISPG